MNKPVKTTREAYTPQIIVGPLRCLFGKHLYAWENWTDELGLTHKCGQCIYCHELISEIGYAKDKVLPPVPVKLEGPNFLILDK